MNATIPKFIVDTMLGRLCKWLRILGYDTIYSTVRDKENLIYQSLRENRIILTRNHNLTQKKAITVIHLQSDAYIDQLVQVIKQVNLEIESTSLFTRCLLCNNQLILRNKPGLSDLDLVQIPKYVYDYQPTFFQCPQCKKMYWPGTHYTEIKDKLTKLQLF